MDSFSTLASSQLSLSIRPAALAKLLAVAALLIIADAGDAADGVWNNTTGGVGLLWSDSGNWQSGQIADGAGFTADFSQLDLQNNVNVDVDSSRTIGHLDFGDTDTNTGGAWNVLDLNTAGSILTLDGNGSTPTITVDPLVAATTIDHAQIVLPLAGTTGFDKLGAGILALGADEAGLTGTISVEAGTLRILETATNVPTVSLGNGTTLDMAPSSPDVGNGGGVTGGVAGATVKAGATATIQSNDNMQMVDVQPEGAGSTLNFQNNGGLFRLYGDWSGGNSYDAINFLAGDFRPRLSSGFNPSSFENTAVSLGDGVELDFRTNSTGNPMLIGSLAGDANSLLEGSANNGGDARLAIGSLGATTDFAGTVDGSGNISINKVGAGTQTFSGSFANFGGRAIRVTEGTLAFSNTATTIQGGDSPTNQTSINVLTDATLDVSGTTSAFTTEANTKIIGGGTIVTTGAGFNHAGGHIAPADEDPSGDPSNDSTSVAGAITFNGGLTFSGGSILYDMGETPGSDDLIQVIGTTNVSGGGVVDPNFLGAAPAAGLTYTLLSGSGGFDVGNGPVAGWTVNWPGRGAKPEVFVNGFDLQFTTTAVGAGGDVLWTGATDGMWDVETTQNWSLGGSPDTFFQGDDVTFDDTGANPAITVAAVVNPGNMVVNSTAAGNNYSFTGNSILATGSLTKQGDSTLTFDTLNEFSSVSVEGGAIDTSQAAGTLGTGQLTLAGGSVVNIFGGVSLANSSIEVSSGTVNTLSYVGTGGAGNSGTRPRLSGLTGDGEVTVEINTDGSWLDLFDTSGFDGTLTIGPDGTNATLLGIVRLFGNQGTNFGGVELNLSSLTLASRQGGEDVGSITYEIGELNGDAATTLLSKTGGTDTDTVWQIGDLNTDSTFAGAIVDDDPSTPEALSHVTKVGTGTLTLSGANTYTGDTTVEDGTLSLTTAFLADTADVFVGATATLDLDHALTDVIDSLYFGNTPQAIGTYSATGSGLGTDFFVDWITGTGILDVTTLGASLANPGDFNGDGVVDAIDYAVWRENLGLSNVALNGNGTDDPSGLVVSADFDLWRDNFGANYNQASGAAPTPEPSAMVSLLLACLAIVGRRRFRIA